MGVNSIQDGRKPVSSENAFDLAFTKEIPIAIEFGFTDGSVFVKRRPKNGELQYSYYVTSLSLPFKGNFLAFDGARGGAEIEQFRNNKSGLSLATRRKHSYLGQIAYVLLTDLAHNLLSDFYHHALLSSKFEGFGLKRIVRDVLATPGRLFFDQGRLQRIELLSQKQNAEDLRFCHEKYCSDRFG